MILHPKQFPSVLMQIKAEGELPNEKENASAQTKESENRGDLDFFSSG